MPHIKDIQIGQRCSFEVYPVAILGNNFKDVRVEGFFSAQIAMAFGQDIAALHANVYNSLPEGTPNDPTQYDYVRISYPSGAYQIIGVPWIRQETVTASTGGTLYLTFHNKTQADIDQIINALSSNGHRPDNINLQAG